MDRKDCCLDGRKESPATPHCVMWCDNPRKAGGPQHTHPNSYTEAVAKVIPSLPQDVQLQEWISVVKEERAWNAATARQWSTGTRNSFLGSERLLLGWTKRNPPPQRHLIASCGATAQEKRVDRNTLTEILTRRLSQRSPPVCRKMPGFRNGSRLQKRNEHGTPPLPDSGRRALATHSSTAWRTEAMTQQQREYRRDPFSAPLVKTFGCHLQIVSLLMIPNECESARLSFPFSAN
jgi:hypothetical protein